MLAGVSLQLLINNNSSNQEFSRIKFYLRKLGEGVGVGHLWNYTSNIPIPGRRTKNCLSSRVQGDSRHESLFLIKVRQACHAEAHSDDLIK